MATASHRAAQAPSPQPFGYVPVPPSQRGPWRVDNVVVTADQVLLQNLRWMRDNRAEMCVEPGTYRRLAHKEHGCVMSNTQMEIRTAQVALRRATGRVLITGLGLGMVLHGILAKPEVTAVLVVELDPHIIKLTAPHFSDTRLRIVRGDARTFKPPAGERFDYAWHDIWDAIDDDNLPDMAAVRKHHRPWAAAQDCWSEPLARRMRRESLAWG